MRFFEWHEGTCDTLRDIVEDFTDTAREELANGTYHGEEEKMLRWALSDAEQVLSDLGEPCDCCREGTYSHPSTGDCLGCHHTPEQHEEYSGPPGEKGVWQS